MRTPHTPERGDLYESVPRGKGASFSGGKSWEVVGKTPSGRYKLRLLMARRPTRIRRTGAELADPFKWTGISVRDLSPDARADLSHPPDSDQSSGSGEGS